jgi:membrane fusion protein
MRAIKALEEGLTTEPERHSRRLQVEALVQALADLKSRIAQAQSDIKIGRQRLEELEVEHRLSMSRLEQEIADSELVIARSQSARAYSLRAPQSGRVVGNLCRPGERVASQQPLLSIAPTASQLVGEFEIPPKAIALINTGQHVRIKYKSLPYQKFGIFTGTVTEVSAEFPAADEAPGRQAAAGTYRAVVSLDRQEIGIADKTIPLQSGMAFQAEIVLEKRVALAWLLDPLR